jgi:hypothetical protein
MHDRTRSVLKLKEPRPTFESMIFNLERAKKQWDMPGLRDYSRILLKLVGQTAISESFAPKSAEIRENRDF